MERFGDFIIRQCGVSRRAVEAAVQEQAVTGVPLGRVLVANGYLTHERMVELLLAWAPDRVISEKVTKSRIPARLLEEHQIQLMHVPEGEGIIYAATLKRESQARAIIESFYPAREIRFTALSADHLDDFLDGLEDHLDEDAVDHHETVLDRLLSQAVAASASDIHLMPRHQSYSAFFREVGVLHLAREGTLEEFRTVLSQVKDRARMDLNERRLPQDGGFKMQLMGRDIDLRVATMPDLYGEKVVIRLLDPAVSKPTLAAIGLSNLSAWREGTSFLSGLSIVCGQTGAGKTTTLNATVREMERLELAVYTVEDPVEFRIAFTTQVTVNPLVGLDFARALRSFLRMDPDVIVLGEIRDPETAAIALRAAETGHRVLATIHTGSIRGAIDRLKELGVREHELQGVLRAVLVQHLVRTICSHCDGAGCPLCRGTGYGGRAAVSECHTFRTAKDFRAVTHEGAILWTTMIEDAVALLRRGKTTVAELYRVFGAELTDHLTVEEQASLDGASS